MEDLELDDVSFEESNAEQGGTAAATSYKAPDSARVSSLHAFLAYS